jgi:hypothetical protein
VWLAEGARTKSKSRRCSRINLWKANCHAVPSSKEAFQEIAGKDCGRSPGVSVSELLLLVLLKQATRQLSLPREKFPLRREASLQHRGRLPDPVLRRVDRRAWGFAAQAGVRVGPDSGGFLRVIFGVDGVSAQPGNVFKAIFTSIIRFCVGKPCRQVRHTMGGPSDRSFRWLSILTNGDPVNHALWYGVLHVTGAEAAVSNRKPTKTSVVFMMPGCNHVLDRN